MRTETINIYRFDELSDDAKRFAWENGPDLSADCSSDFENTLKRFSEIFDIEVYTYVVTDWTYSYSYVVSPSVCCPENKPIRLAKYIYNNYYDSIKRGKYYSTPGKYIDGKYHYKYRHSKCTFEIDNCPLTGFCADMDILDPVIDCLRYKRFFNSYEELIDECLTNFFRVWRDDIEYHASMEYFAEIADINEWEFYETGEFYHG